MFSFKYWYRNLGTVCQNLSFAIMNISYVVIKYKLLGNCMETKTMLLKNLNIFK